VFDKDRKYGLLYYKDTFPKAHIPNKDMHKTEHYSSSSGISDRDFNSYIISSDDDSIIVNLLSSPHASSFFLFSGAVTRRTKKRAANMGAADAAVI
jgi:hypothetical protein